MTGYDRGRRVDALEKECADLRTQADRAWAVAATTAKAALREGILIDDEDLGEHWLELRALDIHAHHRAEALETFRQAVVIALHDALESADRGADPTAVLGALHTAVLVANRRAKDVPLDAARERARRELDRAAAAALDLFPTERTGS